MIVFNHFCQENPYKSPSFVSLNPAMCHWTNELKLSKVKKTQGEK